VVADGGLPARWVINSGRTPTAEDVVLHTADCFTISGRPAKGESWTDAYMKVCAPDRRLLEDWAVGLQIPGPLRQTNDKTAPPRECRV
jgi:hypothetical protein